MTIDELIKALQQIKDDWGGANEPIMVIRKQGAVYQLSGKVVFDAVAGGFCIKTVN